MTVITLCGPPARTPVLKHDGDGAGYGDGAGAGTVDGYGAGAGDG